MMNKIVRNIFLQSNFTTIEKLKTRLIDYHMKGSYGGNLQLDVIISLFDGLINEIEKLQKEIDELKRSDK